MSVDASLDKAFTDGTDPEAEPEPEAPEDQTTEAPDQDTVEAPEPVDPFKDYGGQEAVQTAVDFHKLVQTEAGALNVFYELGRAFGLGVDQIGALFSGTSTPQQDQVADLKDDDVLTGKQVRELIEAQTRPVAERIEAAEQARIEAQARVAIDRELESLGIGAEDTKLRAAILQLGDAYLKDSLDEASVRAAVRQGHADFEALVKSNADRYRQKKVAQKQAVPKTLAGASTPTGSEPEKPKNFTGYLERARAKLEEMA